MKVAVIGGGLFGCTAAIHAARAGHDVSLYEAKSDLMRGASAATFARLHRGYHYPRSPETGRESRTAEASFRREYGAAVIDGGLQSYIVADRGHVEQEGFRAFLEREGLPFFAESTRFDSERLSRTVNVRFDVVEPRIDLSVLRELVLAKVAEAGVKVRLGNRINRRLCGHLRENFDRTIVATYARLNDILAKLGCETAEYRFQVVEKPIVALPEAFRDRSIVVIDGPFGCIDPLDDTEMHVLGHVTRTIHAENVGYSAKLPDHLANLIDRGMTNASQHTRFREVADDLARYIPGVEKAQHIGSAFTVRAVLAHTQVTDARPTLVERMNGQVIKVFSGKLGTAVKAARDVVGMLGPGPEAKPLAAVAEAAAA